mmetsp:Transcript_8027/g.22307  ORF Transcript_8027/g.22307 Transcript_8027/m.22307 type:complete len:334 (+) Transcript_8027:318-1319(+)
MGSRKPARREAKLASKRSCILPGNFPACDACLEDVDEDGLSGPHGAAAHLAHQVAGLLEEPKLAAALDGRRQGGGARLLATAEHLLDQLHGRRPLSRAGKAMDGCIESGRVWLDLALPHGVDGCGKALGARPLVAVPHLLHQRGGLGPAAQRVERLQGRVVRALAGLQALLAHLLGQRQRLLPEAVLHAPVDDGLVANGGGVQTLLPHLLHQLHRMLDQASLAACLDSRLVAGRAGLHAPAPHETQHLQHPLRPAGAAAGTDGHAEGGLLGAQAAAPHLLQEPHGLVVAAVLLGYTESCVVAEALRLDTVVSEPLQERKDLVAQAGLAAHTDG